MRFNDRELTDMSLGDVEMEGVLNHKRPSSGNFGQSGYKERLFKLKSNLLFYFRFDESGKLDDKQPAGVIVLENSNVQYEVCNEVPFAFSLTFRDEPERKHLFSGRSESNVTQWVFMIKQATYEYWRSQLILLQTKICKRTGKDPLLMYPRNQGMVRDIESSSSSSPRTARAVGRHMSTFKSLLQASVQAIPNVANLQEKDLIEF